MFQGLGICQDGRPLPVLWQADDSRLARRSLLRGCMGCGTRAADSELCLSLHSLWPRGGGPDHWTVLMYQVGTERAVEGDREGEQRFSSLHAQAIG